MIFYLPWFDLSNVISAGIVLWIIAGSNTTALNRVRLTVAGAQRNRSHYSERIQFRYLWLMDFVGITRPIVEGFNALETTWLLISIASQQRHPCRWKQNCFSIVFIFCWSVLYINMKYVHSEYWFGNSEWSYKYLNARCTLVRTKASWLWIKKLKIPVFLVISCTSILPSR